MNMCHVQSYQRNWLYVYIQSEPQSVVKQVTIENVLLPTALFHRICGCLVPGK
jgi:hypothetical protein